MKALVINPGSTSTKVAVFEETGPLCEQSLVHSGEELARYDSINAQLGMRTEAVRRFLREAGIAPRALDVIVARGGILPPVRHGAYVVDDHLTDTLLHRPVQQHASNVAAGIAQAISREGGGVPAYIYDSIAVDEMIPEARLSGVKGSDRRSFSHALNTRAVARVVAAREGFDLFEENVIVAHLGGGFSMNIQAKGELIDVVSADEGPFSTERAGGLPIYNASEIARAEGADRLYAYEIGGGGLMSYLGTNDAIEVERRIEAGDEEARLVYDAMAYQIAKSIAGLATVVCGEVRAIILTGGLAHSARLTATIRQRVGFIAPVYVYPGEREMIALAEGGFRLLRGEEKARTFSDPRL